MSKSLKEIIREEYIRCAKDPVYFMKKYCYIQHPIKGKLLFKLYPYQEKLLREYEKEQFNIILKSRQTGISTLTAGYSLWMMLFNSDKNILVIATKRDVAKNLITKVRVMHQELPSWMKAKTAEDNKLSLRFTNGSHIKAESSSQEAGRSEALSLLVFDEAAFIEGIANIWTAASQTLATGGKCIAVSTPNGVGNWFHQTWVGAEEDANGWNPILLHWTVHPERDQAWRERQTELLGEKAAAQECDCDFISSGQSVIDPQLIEYYRQTFMKDPVEKRGPDGNYWIWEYPNYSKDYMIVADVARGDGSDSSAFHVIEVESCEQVAEYRGKPDTKTFGHMLLGAANDYNQALLVVENSNIGWATIQVIIDNQYPNLFYMSKDLKYVDVEAQMTNKFYAQERNMVPGFSTTSKTRPLIISKLDDYFRDKSVTVRSQRTLDELFTFIWSGQRAEAMSGYHDDLVMSLSIALWVRDTALRLRQEGIDITKRTLDMFTIKQRFDPIITNRGYAGGYGDPRQQYKMQVGNETEDLTWLLARRK